MSQGQQCIGSSCDAMSTDDHLSSSGSSACFASTLHNDLQADSQDNSIVNEDFENLVKIFVVGLGNYGACF